MPRKKSSSNSSNYFKKDNNNNVNKKRKRKTTIINNNNATSSPKRISLGDKQYKVESFKHIIGDNNSKPHTLLVGTMPSITSHGLSQYYGHRNNAFWWIISDKFNFRRGGTHVNETWPYQFGFKKDGSPLNVQAQILQALKDTNRYEEDCNVPILSYDEQVKCLNNNGYILWDILKSAKIKNSDDNSIKDGVANDIFGLLIKYPTLNQIVFCSGSTSANLFKKVNKEKIQKLLSNKHAQFHFESGNEAALKVFKKGHFFEKQIKTKRAVKLIVPLSVSPACAIKTYREKSNDWMKCVFKSNPLY